MKRMLSVVLAIGCFSFSGLAPAFGQIEAVSEDANAASSGRQERMIGVTEDMWLRLADEPEHHMNDGFAAYRKGELGTAATAVRKVTVFLQIAEYNSVEPARRVLGAAAVDLENLANQLDDPKAKVTAEQLQRAFASSHLALSRHHGQRSAAAVMDRRVGLAGRYLLSSTRHLERASYWGGQELRDETARQVEAAKKLGRELSEESGKVVEDVGGFIESLGKRIERFGREIRQDDRAEREDQP